jgi:hypothetical protein
MLLLVVVGALAAAALWYLQRRPAPDARTIPLGDKVLRFFPVNEISKVVLRAPSGTLTLEQDDDGIWVVREYYSYPAQFDKVADLLKTLYNMTVGQVVRVRQASLGQMQLVAPDEQGSDSGKGTQVQCYDDSGESIAIVLIGAAKRGEARDDSPYGFAMPEGTFVRLPGNPADLRDERAQVILVKDTFQLGETPDAWIDKQVFNVGNDQLRSIAITAPGGETYAMTRTNAADQFTLPAPPKQQVKASELATLGNALSFFTVDSVLDPAVAKTNTALAAAWTFAATTFDGVVYTIKVTDTNAPAAYAQVTVKYTKPPIESVASNIAAHAASSPDQVQESARALDHKLAQWTFVLPALKANQLRMPKASLFEPVPEPPKAPAAEEKPAAAPET